MYLTELKFHFSIFYILYTLDFFNGAAVYHYYCCHHYHAVQIKTLLQISLPVLLPLSFCAYIEILLCHFTAVDKLSLSLTHCRLLGGK